MPANRSYAKLFYDLDTAKAFGEKVDSIAEQSMAMVPVRRDKLLRTILLSPFSPNAEHIGKFYYVEKDIGSRNRDIYYVRYSTHDPRGSSRADIISAERQIKEYLDQQYQEINPQSGRSLG